MTPQLRIAGPNCSLVRENELKPGTWFLDYPDDTFEDLGDSVQVEILDYQMRATDWVVKPPAVSYDPDSQIYKAIKTRANRNDNLCLYGPEYTVEVIGPTTATLYLGNKSCRNLMSTIRVGGEYNLLARKRTHGRFVWYVPEVIS